MMLTIYFFLAVAQVVFGANRYVIDSKSCSEIHDSVRYYMDTAIAKSGMVADVLSPYVQDPNNKPDDRIMKQMVRLFGKDDVTTAFNIFSHFDPIRHYVWVDMDSRSEAWKQTRDQSDLEVHCDAGYIIPDTSGLEPNIHWHDDVQDLPIVDGSSLLQFQDEATTLVAVTSPALPWKEGETWPSNRPEVVTLHPSYIHKAVEKSMIFNSDRIKKALHPSLLKTIKAKFQRFTHVTKIDVLDTPELTFIHELTHTALSGLSRDTDGRDSYGWFNCVRLKDVENAENLAFFVVVVDLILNYKYDVDDKGNLKSF